MTSTIEPAEPVTHPSAPGPRVIIEAEASEPDAPSAPEPGPSLVQAGWEIVTRDGQPLGEVLGADQRRFLLRDRDDPAKRLELPTTLIASQEVGRMSARIALDAAEVVAGDHGIERIPRERRARSGDT